MSTWRPLMRPLWLRFWSWPLPSNRQHQSYDDCLEVRRENNQNCSVLYCLRQLCTVIRTHMWTVLSEMFSWLFTRCHHSHNSWQEELQMRRGRHLDVSRALTVTCSELQSCPAELAARLWENSRPVTAKHTVQTVSYTHLTLPTILRV